MLILVIENGLTKAELLQHGAPTSCRLNGITGPISRRGANTFGEGSTSMGTAMRVATLTKLWFPTDRPYIYRVTDDAKPALMKMKLGGRVMRGFTIDEISFNKALYIADILMTISSRKWGEIELGKEASTIFNEMTANNESGMPTTVRNILGKRGSQTTRVAAAILQASLRSTLSLST